MIIESFVRNGIGSVSLCGAEYLDRKSETNMFLSETCSIVNEKSDNSSKNFFILLVFGAFLEQELLSMDHPYAP